MFIILPLAFLIAQSAIVESTCKVGSKTYQGGESFIPDSCNGRCKCNADGSYGCTSLCPPMGIPNCPNQVLVQRKVENTNCVCEYHECGCAYEGKTYRVGEQFFPANCQQNCKCLNGGSVYCTSLCPPMGVRCEPNETKVKEMVPIPGTNCGCERDVCKKN